MTMMMMDDDDDDEGGIVDATRSRAQTWICGVKRMRGSFIAVGPAGPPREPSPIFRGEGRDT